MITTDCLHFDNAEDQPHAGKYYIVGAKDDNRDDDVNTDGLQETDDDT